MADNIVLVGVVAEQCNKDDFCITANITRTTRSAAATAYVKNEMLYCTVRGLP